PAFRAELERLAACYEGAAQSDETPAAVFTPRRRSSAHSAGRVWYRSAMENRLPCCPAGLPLPADPRLDPAIAVRQLDQSRDHAAGSHAERFKDPHNRRLGF